MRTIHRRLVRTSERIAGYYSSLAITDGNERWTYTEPTCGWNVGFIQAAREVARNALKVAGVGRNMTAFSQSQRTTKRQVVVRRRASRSGVHHTPHTSAELIRSGPGHEREEVVKRTMALLRQEGTLRRVRRRQCCLFGVNVKVLPENKTVSNCAWCKCITFAVS